MIKTRFNLYVFQTSIYQTYIDLVIFDKMTEEYKRSWKYIPHAEKLFQKNNEER